jgi:hypothetical protein
MRARRSGQVCVCRAKEVSGRLIRNAGKHSDRISLSKQKYVTYLNCDTYLMIGPTYTHYIEEDPKFKTRELPQNCPKKMSLRAMAV